MVDLLGDEVVGLDGEKVEEILLVFEEALEELDLDDEAGHELEVPVGGELALEVLDGLDGVDLAVMRGTVTCLRLSLGAYFSKDSITWR